MVIPLYGFVQGDTLGLLVLAEPDDTALDLSRKLLSAAALRVAPLVEPVVVYRGEKLDNDVTLEQRGITALERFDVIEGSP